MNELLKKVAGKDGLEHRVSIVTAPFCVMWCINDGGYFPGESTLEGEVFRNPMRCNVQFLQGTFESSPK